MNTQNRKILIMGAGMRGICILHHLEKEHIKVQGFLDNDEGKQGKMIEGIPCYAMRTFESCKEDVTVFYSIVHNPELEIEVHTIYPHMMGESECNKLLFFPEEAGYSDMHPLGHFYNLYPQIEEIEKNKESLYNLKKKIEDINLNEKGQFQILKELSKFYNMMPEWKDIKDKTDSPYRFRKENYSFSISDAIVLSSMIQFVKPKRVIEVGSGWTSAVMLDTNEYRMDGTMELSFIEPYADRFRTVLKPTDLVELKENKLEGIDLNYFNKLEAGDILFIDSSHVSKIGSDVNYIFFELLPRLKNGVYIHFHDIFYPFEYPINWLKKGWVWNELYLLRSFLQNNEKYEIVYFHHMMQQLYPKLLYDCFPKNTSISGGSFWMKKK